MFRGRIQHDESRPVAALLVRGILVLLPGGLVGNVRLGLGAGRVGVHAAVFPDGHRLEVDDGEGVLGHRVGLLLGYLLLAGLGELRFDAEVEPLPFRIEGRLASARDADLPGLGRLALARGGHIPYIQGSVSLLRVDGPDDDVAVICLDYVSYALPRVIDAVVKRFLLRRGIRHSGQGGGQRQSWQQFDLHIS